MKNKKLFAILTLVCFMFTLMPVAAFAAADPAVLVNGEESDIVEAGAEFNVAVADGETGVTYNYMIVAVDDEDDDVATGTLYDVATTGSALKISDIGIYQIFALSATDVTSVDAWAKLKADKLEGYLEAESLVEEYAVLEIEAADVAYVINVYNEAGKLVGSSNEEAVLEATVSVDASGSYDAAALVAELETANGKAVKGVELGFKDNGIDVVEVDTVTDRNGKFDFTVSGTTVGKFEVEVSYDDVEAVVEVSVGYITPATVTTLAQPKAPVDVKTPIVKSGIVVKLTDANGNVIKTTPSTDDYKITVVEQPAKSKIKTGDVTLYYNTDKAMMMLYGPTLTVEGDYTFKIALENGASATASVTVQEFDEAVAISMAYKAKTVGLGETVKIDTLKAIDADGVTFDLIDEINGDVKLAANGGAAVAEFDATNGDLTVTTDKDYIGSVVTVVAVYDDELIATVDITIVAAANELALVNKAADVAVTNTLTWNVVNGEGEVVALNVKDDTTPVVKAVVQDKPENAYVAVANGSLKDNNKVTIDFTPSVAGEYKVLVYVTYTEEVGEKDVTRYISGVETITVGAKEGTFKDVVVVSINADKIVVNSDVKEIPAPAVIKDSRTFVPFRALAEAFGAVVDYDQATGAVTAELNGVKVVMMNGEKAYTVNGVAKTADVAPYLNAEAGTTMVPVSFVAKAFGINYQCIYAEDGTVADVLFAK